jgi:guanylate kinase
MNLQNLKWSMKVNIMAPSNRNSKKYGQITKLPLVDIDVQGALRLKKHYGANALSIFIKAPSLEILKQRLIDRGTETDFSLNERIEKATHELTYAGLFDTLVINDNLEQACKEAGEKILLFLSEQI